MNLLIFYLPIILFFGIITSYEDLKFGKIRNKWILISVIYSIFILFSAKFFGIKILQNYMIIFVINLFVSLIVGILLWRIHLWSPGDAKLFFAYSIIIPITSYELGFTYFFPSYILLINTFTPLFVFYLIKVIFKTKMKTKIQALKHFMKIKIIFITAVSIFGLMWVLTPLFSLLGFYPDLFILSMILFLMISFIEYLVPLKQFHVFVIIAIMRLVFDKSIYSFEFLKNFSLVLLLFLIIRFFLLTLSYFFFTKPVYVEDLKPNMLLADMIYKDGSKYVKEDNIVISIFSALYSSKRIKPLFKLKPLGENNVKLLKRLHSQGKFEPHEVRIHEVVPFALYMFIGALLTILCQGNFLLAIRMLIEKFI